MIKTSVLIYLAEYINANPDFGVNIQYSTLSRYFDALNKAQAEFPSFFGDFFPYADNGDSYWTVRKNIFVARLVYI